MSNDKRAKNFLRIYGLVAVLVVGLILLGIQVYNIYTIREYTPNLALGGLGLVMAFIGGAFLLFFKSHGRDEEISITPKFL